MKPKVHHIVYDECAGVPNHDDVLEEWCILPGDNVSLRYISHRTDGPAVIERCGYVEWWVNGLYYAGSRFRNYDIRLKWWAAAALKYEHDVEPTQEMIDDHLKKCLVKLAEDQI